MKNMIGLTGLALAGALAGCNQGQNPITYQTCETYRGFRNRDIDKKVGYYFDPQPEFSRILETPRFILTSKKDLRNKLELDHDYEITFIPSEEELLDAIPTVCTPESKRKVRVVSRD